MVEQMDKLVSMFERKLIDRRQLLTMLAAAASAPAATAEAAPASALEGLGLNHVTVAGKDLERSRAFYEQLLGLSMLHNGPSHGMAFYNLRLKGNNFISLIRSDTPHIDHLCVAVANFDADRIT